MAAVNTSTAGRRIRGKSLIVVLFLLLVGLAVAAGWFLIPSSAKESVSGIFNDNTLVVSEKPKFIDLDEMVVALFGNSSRQRFLKVSITLEIPEPADEALVRELLPLVIDSYQFFLRELRVEELQGSTGLYAVKEELLARTNLVVSPARVRDVLFRDFLIQ